VGTLLLASLQWTLLKSSHYIVLGGIALALSVTLAIEYSCYAMHALALKVKYIVGHFLFPPVTHNAAGSYASACAVPNG